MVVVGKGGSGINARCFFLRASKGLWRARSFAVGACVGQPSLPGRAHAELKVRQALSESDRGARHVGRGAHEGKPCEHIGFGVVRRAAVPKRDLDQAARINPGTIVVGSYAWK